MKVEEREISTDVLEGRELSESEANGQKFGKWRRKLEAPSREPKRKAKWREARVHELETWPSLLVWEAAAARDTSELPAGSKRCATGRRKVSKHEGDRV